MLPAVVSPTLNPREVSHGRVRLIGWVGLIAPGSPVLVGLHVDDRRGVVDGGVSWGVSYESSGYPPLAASPVCVVAYPSNGEPPAVPIGAECERQGDESGKHV